MSQSAAKQVLEVIKVEPSGENQWKVVGLTYETIAIGDKLYILGEQETLNPHLAFEISRIEVFKREISEIDRGFGVRLLLIGEAGERLKEVKHLYT